MATFYDEDGNEHEAFTAEEVEAQRQEAITKFKEENPDFADAGAFKTQLEDKEKELEQAKKDLEAEKNKGNNTSAARKVIEEKEAEINKLKEDFTGQIESLKTTMDQKEINNLIKKASNGDLELEKKMQEHLKTTLSGMKTETDEEKAAAVSAAYKLSSGSGDPGIFDSGAAGSGGMGGTGGGDGTDPNKPNQALVEFGQKYFGISQEDWKKYGGKKYQTWSKDN